MLGSANQKSSGRIKPFAACSRAKKLVIAHGAAIVVIDIVAVMNIKTVKAFS